MDKEDILARNRVGTNDEGMEYAENKGRKTGYVVFCLLFGFIIIYNFFLGETIVYHAVSSLFWAFLSAESYPKYCFTKKKAYLVILIAGSLASVLSLLNYIVITLR